VGVELGWGGGSCDAEPDVYPLSCRPADYGEAGGDGGGDSGESGADFGGGDVFGRITEGQTLYFVTEGQTLYFVGKELPEQGAFP
jgi:hypothetical protein